ncbi:right-handed parallel beta-helix repeat-containing protein [Candidatus Micrarchaeota archaeon]|nr:right-handed parallel beta-helix repeat-containing protein [Candidatus Micrarchaeota archaeon]
MRKIIISLILIFLVFGCISEPKTMEPIGGTSDTDPTSYNFENDYGQYTLRNATYTRTSGGVSVESSKMFVELNQDIELLQDINVVQAVKGITNKHILSAFKADDVIIADIVETTDQNIPLEMMGGTAKKQTIEITNKGDEKQVTFKINQEVYSNTFYYGNEKIILETGDIKTFESDDITYGDLNIRKIDRGYFKIQLYDGTYLTYDPMDIAGDIEKVELFYDGIKTKISIYVNVFMPTQSKIIYDPTIVFSDEKYDVVFEDSIQGNQYIFDSCYDGKLHIAIFSPGSVNRKDTIKWITNPGNINQNERIIYPSENENFQTIKFGKNCELYVAKLNPAEIVKYKMTGDAQTVIERTGMNLFLRNIEIFENDEKEYLGIGSYSYKTFSNVYLVYELNKSKTMDEPDKVYYTNEFVAGEKLSAPQLIYGDGDYFVVVNSKNAVYKLENIDFNKKEEIFTRKVMDVLNPAQIIEKDGKIYVAGSEGVFDINGIKVSETQYAKLSKNKDMVLFSTYNKNADAISLDGKLKTFVSKGDIYFVEKGYVQITPVSDINEIKYYAEAETQELNCDIPEQGTYTIVKNNVVCKDRNLENVVLDGAYFKCIDCKIKTLNADNSFIEFQQTKVNNIYSKNTAIRGTFDRFENALLGNTVVEYHYFVSPVKQGWWEVLDQQGNRITEGVITPETGLISFEMNYKNEFPWKLVVHSSYFEMEGGAESGSGGVLTIDGIGVDSCGNLDIGPSPYIPKTYILNSDLIINSDDLIRSSSDILVCFNLESASPGIATLDCNGHTITFTDTNTTCSPKSIFSNSENTKLNIKNCNIIIEDSKYVNAIQTLMGALDVFNTDITYQKGSETLYGYNQYAIFLAMPQEFSIKETEINLEGYEFFGIYIQSPTMQADKDYIIQDVSINIANSMSGKGIWIKDFEDVNNNVEIENVNIEGPHDTASKGVTGIHIENNNMVGPFSNYGSAITLENIDIELHGQGITGVEFNNAVANLNDVNSLVRWKNSVALDIDSYLSTGGVAVGGACPSFVDIPKYDHIHAIKIKESYVIDSDSKYDALCKEWNDFPSSDTYLPNSNEQITGLIEGDNRIYFDNNTYFGNRCGGLLLGTPYNCLTDMLPRKNIIVGRIKNSHIERGGAGNDFSEIETSNDYEFRRKTVPSTALTICNVQGYYNHMSTYELLIENNTLYGYEYLGLGYASHAVILSKVDNIKFNENIGKNAGGYGAIINDWQNTQGIAEFIDNDFCNARLDDIYGKLNPFIMGDVFVETTCDQANNEGVVYNCEHPCNTDCVGLDVSFQACDASSCYDLDSFETVEADLWNWDGTSNPEMISGEAVVFNLPNITYNGIKFSYSIDNPTNQEITFRPVCYILNPICQEDCVGIYDNCSNVNNNFFGGEPIPFGSMGYCPDYHQKFEGFDIEVWAGYSRSDQQRIDLGEIQPCEYIQCYFRPILQTQVPAWCDACDITDSVSFYNNNTAPTLWGIPELVVDSTDVMCSINGLGVNDLETHIPPIDCNTDNCPRNANISILLNDEMFYLEILGESGDSAAPGILNVEIEELSVGDEITCCVQVTDNSECCPLWSNQICFTQRININGYVHIEDYTETTNCSGENEYVCEFGLDVPVGSNEVNLSWVRLDEDGNIIENIDTKENVGFVSLDDFISNTNLGEQYVFVPNNHNVCKCDRIACLVSVKNSLGTQVVNAMSYGSHGGEVEGDSITQDDYPLIIENTEPVISYISVNVINMATTDSELHMQYKCSYEANDGDSECEECVEEIGGTYTWSIDGTIIEDCENSETCSIPASVDASSIQCCIDIVDSVAKYEGEIFGSGCQGNANACATPPNIEGNIHLNDYSVNTVCDSDTTYVCEFDINLPSDLNGDGEPDVGVDIGWANVDEEGGLDYIFWKENILISEARTDGISNENLDEYEYTEATFVPGEQQVCKCDKILCVVNITDLEENILLSIPSYSGAVTDIPISGIEQDEGYLNILNQPPIFTSFGMLIEEEEDYLSYTCGYTYEDKDLECEDCEEIITETILWNVLIPGDTYGEEMETLEDCENENNCRVSTEINGVVCCVELTDSLRREGCQEAAYKCSTPCFVDITVGFEPPLIESRPSPDDIESCPAILPDEPRNEGCAYEDSNFTCFISVEDLEGDDEILRVCFDILDQDNNVIATECDDNTDNGYWDITWGGEDCLENENCVKGKELHCKAKLETGFGTGGICMSPIIVIHNFKPAISPPALIMVSNSVPTGISIGDYEINESFITDYNDSYVCVPVDEWKNYDRTPDYNNDDWKDIAYYWEWSPVDIGFVTTTCNEAGEVETCEYTTDYTMFCTISPEGEKRCFDDVYFDYLCKLSCERQTACLESEKSITCWGADIYNQSHWLLLNPLVYNLTDYEAFGFIPSKNVTYGLCPWVVEGAMCNEPFGTIDDCIGGMYIGTDELAEEIISDEGLALKQCGQSTTECYKYIEYCIYDPEWRPGDSLPELSEEREDCRGNYISVIGLDVGPEDYCEESYETIEWEYVCDEICDGEYGEGVYYFWFTSWYRRFGSILSIFPPYMDELCACDSNQYFGLKENPNLPHLDLKNIYMNDIMGLFYLNIKPHGMPMRCCIQMSDEGFESAYSDMQCSNASTCGLYLGCGYPIYETSDEGDVETWVDDPYCSALFSEAGCFLYLKDSCDETVVWNITTNHCGNVLEGEFCVYRTENGTAFTAEQHINVESGESAYSITEDVTECYPCMEYWPMGGDPDFEDEDFEDFWGYYYKPWWLREVLWDRSYEAKESGHLGELPMPDKVNLYYDYVSYETVSMEGGEDRIEYPCDPNEDPECEISFVEWSAGPSGAYQNDVMSCDPSDEQIEWLEIMGSLNNEEISELDEFTAVEEGGANIVGRFFATRFTYCNQWDEVYVSDLLDYTKDQIDENYGYWWPEWERTFVYMEDYNSIDKYPWAGRLGMEDYVTRGLFRQPNGIKHPYGLETEWVWNYESDYNNYASLDCSALEEGSGLYEQCRKHSRISCDYEFGVVYNYTETRIHCNCIEDANEYMCEERFGLRYLGPNWIVSWNFNSDQCRCIENKQCNMTYLNEIKPEDECETSWSLYNCNWICRPATITPPIEPPPEPGWLGTIIFLMDENENILINDEKIESVMLSDNQEIGKIIHTDYTGRGDTILFYPTSDEEGETIYCEWNVEQNELENCFSEDVYFNSFVEYAQTGNEELLTVNFEEHEPINIGRSRTELPEEYASAVFDSNYYRALTLWNTEECTPYVTEKIGYEMTNRRVDETENQGCAFCTGLLVNNSAPVLEAPCRDYELVSETIYSFNASVFWEDIDTHPADSASVVYYRFCSEVEDTNGDGENDDCIIDGELSDWIEVVNEDVANIRVPNLTNHGIDLGSLNPDEVWVCAYGNDTGWQSKQSNKKCSRRSCLDDCVDEYPPTINNLIMGIDCEGFINCIANVSDGNLGDNNLTLNFVLINTTVESSPRRLTEQEIKCTTDGEYGIYCENTLWNTTLIPVSGNIYTCEMELEPDECGKIAYANTSDMADLCSEEYPCETIVNLEGCYEIGAEENAIVNIDLNQIIDSLPGCFEACDETPIGISCSSYTYILRNVDTGIEIDEGSYSPLTSPISFELPIGNYELEVESNYTSISGCESPVFDYECAPKTVVFEVKDYCEYIPVYNCSVLTRTDLPYRVMGDINLPSSFLFKHTLAGMAHLTPAIYCCLVLDNDNVELDLNGHSVIARNYNDLPRIGGLMSESAGICSFGKENLLIKNGTIESRTTGHDHWSYSMILLSVKNATIKDINRSRDGVGGGIWLDKYSTVSPTGYTPTNPNSRSNMIVENVLIDNHKAEKSKYYSIIARNFDGLVINNSYFNNHIHGAVWISPIGEYGTPNRNLKIINSRFENRLLTSFYTDAYVRLHQTQGVLIENNTFLGGHEGIVIGEDSRNVWILNNTLTNSRDKSISIRNDVDITIINNNITGSAYGTYGIDALSWTITNNNYCYNLIDLDIPSTGSSYLRCRDNYASTYGDRLRSSSIMSQNIQCENCKIDFVSVNPSNVDIGDIVTLTFKVNTTSDYFVNPINYERTKVVCEGVERSYTLNVNGGGIITIEFVAPDANSCQVTVSNIGCEKTYPVNIQTPPGPIPCALTLTSLRPFCVDTNGNVTFNVSINPRDSEYDISDVDFTINSEDYGLTPSMSGLSGSTVLTLGVGSYVLNAVAPGELGCAQTLSISIPECEDPSPTPPVGPIYRPKIMESSSGESGEYTKTELEDMEVISFDCELFYCNKTAECCFGYCENNRCNFPSRPDYLFDWFAKPGCEGLPIEPTDFFGHLICDLMWVWVGLISVLAAWYSRKHAFKPMPAVAFFIPMTLALLVLPYLGLVASIFEIFLFSRHYSKIENMKNKEKKK